MNNNKTNNLTKILVIVTFLAMIIVNGLANILPINGQNTGQVSNYYKNLFVPAAITFSIWGIIYVLLAGYTLYQLVFFQGNKSEIKSYLLYKVGIYFSISSVANGAWVFAWHYHLIPLSMVFMFVIVVSLILITKEIKNYELSLREKVFIKLPFSVYFGWITVASIANIVTLFVSLGWNNFGTTQWVWTSILILVGAIIGSVVTIKNRDIAYGVVIIWAYIGILIKHMSQNGFAGFYPAIIVTVIICIITLIIAEVYVFMRKNGK